VFGDLTTQDAAITFTDSVVVSGGRTVDAGVAFVSFDSSGAQSLTAGAGTLANTAGTFDANDQPVTVARLATITGGSYLAGTAPQTFAGGLVIAGLQ
jgi:hypothetical protein